MASIIRIVICDFLISQYDKGFKNYIIKKYDYIFKMNSEQSDSNEDYNHEVYDDECVRIFNNILKIVEGFYKGISIKTDDIDYKEIYVYLTRNDISIKSIFNLDIHTTEENIFLFESIKYLKKYNDEYFGTIFWKYINIKNIVYQALTENNYIYGLDYFQKYFKKSTEKTQSAYDHMKKCIENQLSNPYIRKMEIRMGLLSTTVKSNIKKSIYNQLRDFFRVYKEILERQKYGSYFPKLGIVYHFIKKKDTQFFEKCWCKEDIHKRNNFYGLIQKEYISAIEILLEIRNEIPNISKYVVGIDAASLENNAEPWVFAPIYQRARDSSHKRFILNSKNRKDVQSLGFTYHVGEEFRHILSGLRHIDEVIEHFGYHAGDRIGHGIVLGIDVEKWCDENPIIVIPRIEYLENMLWVWALGYYNIIEKDMIDPTQIERVIMTEAQKIFINIQGITVYQLWCAYQNKFKMFSHNEEYMHKICNDKDKDIIFDKGRIFCSLGDEKIWTVDMLTHTYQCKCYLERMYEVIHLKVNSYDIKLLKHLQKIMKKKLSRKGIVIETNPTSNLSISGIERLFKHHIINLNDVGLEKNDEDNGLVITINSDDPSVFNTNSANEFGYIFYLLQDKGYSRNAILDWIDKVRQWGMDTSFIKDRNMDIKETIDEIQEILKQLT